MARHIDLAACTKYKVALAEGEGSTISPAELTWNLIMSAKRELLKTIEAMKNGLWQVNFGSSLYRQVIGISDLERLAGWFPNMQRHLVCG